MGKVVSTLRVQSCGHGRALSTAPGGCGVLWGKVVSNVGLRVEFLTFSGYHSAVQATLTSKGQITIPVKVRNRLHLKPGDVLEFDETAPFLKATKTIPPEAWEAFGKGWADPWVGQSMAEVMDELRGPVELPHTTAS
jgi:AbrB family looped-hinge helix DNA binding protein